MEGPHECMWQPHVLCQHFGMLETPSFHLEPKTGQSLCTHGPHKDNTRLLQMVQMQFYCEIYDFANFFRT